MSTDKRTFTTDALETLGAIIDDGAGRDAIHLAVEPVVAGMLLRPGEDVGIKDGEAFDAKFCEKTVGIVDPFLKQLVKTGQRFWLVLYPRQITSLRHVWTHPAFDEVATPPAPDKSAAEAWMAERASQLRVPVSELLSHARQYVLNNGYYWTGGSNFEGERIDDQFWDHYERVTGEPVAESDRGNFLNCSC